MAFKSSAAPLYHSLVISLVGVYICVMHIMHIVGTMHSVLIFGRCSHFRGYPCTKRGFIIDRFMQAFLVFLLAPNYKAVCHTLQTLFMTLVPVILRNEWLSLGSSELME